MPSVNGMKYPDTLEGHDEARQALKIDRQQFHMSLEGKKREPPNITDALTKYMESRPPAKMQLLRKGGSVSKSQNSGLYGRKKGK